MVQAIIPIPDSLRERIETEANDAIAAAQARFEAVKSARLNRQLKLYRFSAEALIALGQSVEPIRCVRSPIPADAEPVGVNFDYERNCFAVCVASAEFEPVPLGQVLPWADDPWFKVVPVAAVGDQDEA